MTLVTGDQVTVRTPRTADEPSVSVRPAAGREHVRFAARQYGGEVHVVPGDVSALVGTGQLDRELFNVTRLLEYGYDDRSRSDLPLIVTYDPGAARSRTALAGTGTAVVRDLPSVSGVAVRQQKSGAQRFWTSLVPAQRAAAPPRDLAGGVARVLLDGRVRATLDRSVPQIGAPTAWQRGYTGEGATVAVLDSGIDTAHPDLAGAVTAERDFTASPSGPRDVLGHGTHVAGIITGDGSASGGTYVGVAPDVRLLNGKVLDDAGFGTDSSVLDGMEWAVEQGADVVNMSVGTPFPSEGDDVVEQAVNRLTAGSGTLFVIAAGNSGPRPYSVGSPGAADAALTVGAVDEQDELAFFSSRGPRMGDNGIKPEVTAPGVEINSARVGDGSGEAYTRKSGTSMATPHVAGAAAILAARRPEWTAAELKSALMGSAEPNANLTVYEQGAGRVNLDRATVQDVRATPPVVNNGTPPWPYADDPPRVTPVTYHNDSAEPVTLALRLDVRGPTGEPAPAGLFGLDRDEVTVAAHASATVEVTTDTGVPAPLGTYGGMLTATGGPVTVHTPVGLTLEPESYDVTLTMLDAAGNPTDAYQAMLINSDTGAQYEPYNPSGTVRTRVPKGHYYLSVTLFTGATAGTVKVEPDVVVDGDRTITVDARDGVPVGFEVDRPEARTGTFLIGIRRNLPAGTAFSFLFGDTLEGLGFVPSTSSVPDEEFRVLVESHLARPDGAGGFRGSPYLYHAMFMQRGRVPATMVRRLHDRDFGMVRSEIAATAPGQTASMLEMASRPTPTTITEYYLPDYKWFTHLWMLTDPAPGALPDSVQTPLPRTMTKGERRTERWNAAVFGPAFPHSPDAPFVYSWRSGENMRIDVSTFSDQAANHQGWSGAATGETTVLRNGQQIGTTSPFVGFGDFPVTDEPATYEVRTEGTQDVEELSTTVRASWRFRSQGGGEGQQALPMAAVRFAPDLDERNRVRAGRLFAFPVTVEQQAGATFGRPRALTVEASYDDGRSWYPVPLLGTGWQHRVAVVYHPRWASYVSLRASATDSAGNQVNQTIIRAYALSRR